MMFNCALKGSNYDLRLSKIPKFGILASNKTSSSTKLHQCPLKKMIPFLDKLLQLYIEPQSCMTLTLTKINIYITLIIGLTLFSINICFSLLKITKVISRLLMGYGCLG